MQVGIHVLRPSALPIVEVSPFHCQRRVHLPCLVCTAEANPQHLDAPRKCSSCSRGLHLQRVCKRSSIVADDVTAFMSAAVTCSAASLFLRTAVMVLAGLLMCKLATPFLTIAVMVLAGLGRGNDVQWPDGAAVLEQRAAEDHGAVQQQRHRASRHPVQVCAKAIVSSSATLKPCPLLSIPPDASSPLSPASCAMEASASGAAHLC